MKDITSSFFSSKKIDINREPGLEARGILKDVNIRIYNRTQLYVGDKTPTEIAIVYSMCPDLDSSLALYNKLKLRRGPLLVAKIRRYYIPRRVIAKLGIKTLRLDNTRTVKDILKKRAEYGLQGVIASESMIQADSVFWDFSTVTKLIKSNTIDRGMRLTTKVRAMALDIYKEKIEAYKPDDKGLHGYKHKIVYFNGSFLKGTGIRTSIILNTLMKQFSPLLLFLEWMTVDMEGFKAWMREHRVVFVFDNNNGKSMTLVHNDAFLNSRNFNIRYILARLHMLDGKEIAEVEKMIEEDISFEKANPQSINYADEANIDENEMTDEEVENKVIILKSTKTAEVEEPTDIAEAEEELNFESFEEVEDNEEDITNLDNISNDTEEEIFSDVTEELEDEIEEIALDVSDNKITKNNKKQEELFKTIIDDKDSSNYGKALSLLEVHNYTNLKNAVETKEVKTLRRRLVSKSITPKEIASDIKRHTLKVEDTNVSPNSDFSKNMINTYTKHYKENFLNDDFDNIIRHPMNYTYPSLLVGTESVDISDREFKGKLTTFTYESHNGQKLEFKLQIPETTEDGRIYIGGSYKRLTFQNSAKPVIKSGENVIITNSGGRKVICSIQGNFASMEEKSVVMTLKALSNITKDIRIKTTKDLGDFIFANRVSYPLIYLNRYYTGIRNKDVDIDFRGISKEGNVTYMGHIRETKVYHNPEDDSIYYKEANTGKRRVFSSMQFILELVNILYPEFAQKAIAQSQSVTHSRINGAYAKIMGKEIPIILLLMIAMPLFKKDNENGLLDVLKETLGLEYKVVKNSNLERLPTTNRIYGVIPLQDYTLIIKYNSVTAELLLSPLFEMDLSSYGSLDINIIMQDYIGNSNTTLYVENFVEDFIDPITQRICNVYGIPDNFVGIMLYATSLFTDYKTYTSSDIRNYRLVGPDEVINRCIYQVLSEAFAANNAKMKRGSRADITIPSDAVIQMINKLTSKAEANDISPTRSIMQRTEVSFKGHGGVNEARSYTMERRLFAEHNYGTETRSTAYSANAGVKKFLPFNPVISDGTGSYESKDVSEMKEELNPSNMYSFVESLIPYVDSDHVNRVIMASGQYGHILPIEGADPLPVSSYTDDAAIYMTPQFSYFAKDNGIVKEVNDDFIIIEYGKDDIEAVKLDNVIRNSDKGYYLKNDFTLSKTFTVGDKIKKNDLIAYNKNFYKKKNNGTISLAYATLQHVLMVDHSNCYEDSCVMFESLSKALATPLVKRIARTIDLNSTIADPITDIHSNVDASTILLKYSQLSDDDTINAIFADADNLLYEEMTAKYKGSITDIRIYYRLKKDTVMSTSVKNFLKEVSQKQRLQRHNKSLEQITSKFDKVNMSGEPQLLTAGKFSKINGDTIEDGKMLIEYFIRVTEAAGAGDKIVLDRGLKGEPSVTLPDELGPVGSLTGRRPKLMFSNYSELNRMTSGLNKHGRLLMILADAAIRARMILGIKPEAGSLLDFKSSMDMVEGKVKYKE